MTNKEQPYATIVIDRPWGKKQILHFARQEEFEEFTSDMEEEGRGFSVVEEPALTVLGPAPEKPVLKAVKKPKK